MRVYLGSDHAGFELKAHLASHLAKQGYEVVDVGPHAYDPDDDYPAFCLHTGARVVADPGSLGVVIGGSGNGEQIAANKVAGVRAALAWNVETARLGRAAQRRQRRRRSAPGSTPLDEATAIVEAFLTHAVLRQRAARPAHRPGRRVRDDPRAAELPTADCPT